jgi:putative glutamine amidotransferase
MNRKRPLIGISAYEVPAAFSHWRDVDCVMVPAAYTRSVLAAGGLPLVLPPADGGAEVLDVLDAIVFVGGSDLNPQLYGQDPHPDSLGFYDHRDRAELELMRAALERDLPMLGICRGMQLLNVERGGDLHQHVPDVTPDPDVHKAAPGTYARHEVAVDPRSRLGGMLGDRVLVHSCHHQAPDRIGSGLTVTATALDGTVEGIELGGKTFAVGVLWHPEEDDEAGAPLFRELMQRARAWRERRAA